jgi:hypothetical protein
MKGAAARPGDPKLDAGAPPGRAPEHAEFAMARVAGGSRWSAFAITALAAIVMGMVGVAVGSRLATVPPAAPFGAVATASTEPTTPPTPAPRPTVAFLRVPIIPVQTSDPASTAIQLQVQHQPTEMFVHGDVYVPRVTWVFVSLRDPTGTVTGWSSVSVPGGAGPAKRGGPTMRFDVELAVPADFTGALTVQATAYDGTGKVIGSTQLVTAPVPAQ